MAGRGQFGLPALPRANTVLLGTLIHSADSSGDRPLLHGDQIRQSALLSS